MSARSVRVSVLLSLFAYVSIGPNACINATHFADFALVRPLAAQAPAPNYTYTVIADVSNCYTIGSPVLNNKGEAAFVAHCGAPIGPPGGVVVRRGDGGGALAEIYTFGPASTFGVLDSVISINDNGAVAFLAGPARRWRTSLRDPGRRWGSGQRGRRYRPAPAVQGAVGRPSINNSGAVAFMAVTTTSGYDTVVVANGGSFLTIAGPGSATPASACSRLRSSRRSTTTASSRSSGRACPTSGCSPATAEPLTTISLNNPSTSLTASTISAAWRSWRTAPRCNG